MALATVSPTKAGANAQWLIFSTLRSRAATVGFGVSEQTGEHTGVWIESWQRQVNGF